MTTKTFNEMFAEAENNNSYWTEVAILDFTSDLWQLMESQGITKRELAKRVGTSPAYITKIFQGNANFTIESMVKFTRALGGNLHVHVAREEAEVRWTDVLHGSTETEEPIHETVSFVPTRKENKAVFNWAKIKPEMIFTNVGVDDAAA